MTATAKEKNELPLFVKREIDNYKQHGYGFLINAYIIDRAGNGQAWESITNMVSTCCMSLSRACLLALQILNLAEITQ